MIGWLQAQAWKLVGLGAAAVALSLGVALAFQLGDKARITAERGALHRAINDPDTGYVVRLNTCRTTAASLEQAIEDQNARVRAQAEESARRVAAAEAAVGRARAETEAANARVAAFLSAAPQGATVCERVEDVDRRFLEMLR